jgi:hypothetical protein
MNNKKLHYITIFGRRYGVNVFPYRSGYQAECIRFTNIIVFSENEHNALMDMEALLKIKIASLMKQVVQVVSEKT